MKISTQKPLHEQGTILLASLIVSAVIGVTLASYLLMVQNQNVSVVRSQTWNSSIAVTEAGVEDALALLNKYSGNIEQLTNWSTSSSIAADNWTALGGNVYHVQRRLGESYYDVYITNHNNSPSIYAIGVVPWRYASATPQSVFATAGIQSSSPTLLTRRVDVRTKIDPLFAVAMAAERRIDLNGKNIATDSFDSMDPLYSTDGLYDPAKTKDNGDVVTNDTLTDSLSVGNATIKGQVKTGPNGSVTIGPNGAVGSAAWVEAGNKGIEPGYSADDMNVLFPIPTLPQATYMWPISGVINHDGTLVTYNAVLGNGDYYLGGLGTGNYKIYVNGHATLYVFGNINFTGQDILRIAPGASLKLYMGGTSARFAGNSIMNENGNAASFYYYGLESNTSLDMSGNAAFTGAIYAPNANFSLGGGGNDSYDFVGASVTRTVRMNGHFKFHYDENLRRNGMGRGYIPTSWKEL
jgi:hypothetical protein